MLALACPRCGPVHLAAVVGISVLLTAGEFFAAEPAREGIYIAVGYGGRRLSSLDGVTWRHDMEWAAQGGDDDNCLFNAASGKGLFVVVGGGASRGHIHTTRDGANWREVAQRRSRVATVAFGNDRFVAGTSDRFLVSTDGERWEDGGRLETPGSIHLRKCAFGNGLFVVIGDLDPPGKQRISFRAVTSDGQRVASLQVDSPPARAIAFGQGRFVAVGPRGLRESSADGQHWEHRAAGGEETLDSVVWDGQRFLAAGGGLLYSSPNGADWSTEPKAPPCSLMYARSGLYVGSSWGGHLWHSRDGSNWQRSGIAPGNAIEAVAFGVIDQEK